MDTPFSQTMDLCCKNLLPLKEYARRENNEINRFLNGCVKRAILIVKNWKFQVEKQLNLMNLRGVFQKYAERFHRMFATAAKLMLFYVKHAWYILIKYR